MVPVDSLLAVPGHVIGSTDGRSWLVLSSVSTKDGVSYKLADLAGNPVPTPPDFDPVPFRAARIATLLKTAFDKNVDVYVKAYIRDADLPVDQSMAWDKYLYQIFSTALRAVGVVDEDYIDETIRDIVTKVMGDRHVLSEQFSHIVRNFTKKNPKFSKLPLEKQVTDVLKNSFRKRIGEARRYAREVILGQDVSEGVTNNSLISMTPEEEGGPSLLDVMEAPSSQFEQAEENVELGDYRGRMKHWTMGRFAQGFYEWLLKHKLASPEARQYMRLLSLMNEEVKSVGKMPKLKDIEQQWVTTQNYHEKSNNRLDHDGRHRLFQELPVLVELYVRTHFHGQESVLPAVIRVLNRYGQERREEVLEESHRDREERKQEKERNKLAPSTDEAALHQSSAKKQWEPSACSACGTGKDVKKCKGCDKHFCSLCEKDHQANNPSHDGLLSKSAAAWTPHKGDWFECSEYHATLPKGGKGMKHQVDYIGITWVQDTNGIGHYIVHCHPSSNDGVL